MVRHTHSPYKMFRNALFFVKILAAFLPIVAAEIRRAFLATRFKIQRTIFGGSSPDDRTRNIVILGASFSGHHAARVLVSCLPPRSNYRVVVIEPNSHFQFTWVLPRFCVAKGHEHKAFIPYGGYATGPEGALQWIKGRAETLSKDTVTVDTGEEVPYDFVLIATGASVGSLPSRVNRTEKFDGMKLLQDMQHRIESAKTVVVVGGGAAGVEVATDAKSLYPEKSIILVHPRKALMHRFGTGLQERAKEGVDKVGVELILEDRVIEQADGSIKLMSGRTILCDYVINCTGQTPNSDVLKHLSPKSVSPSGYIRVKPTLQIRDDSLPNVYSCGDVTDTDVPTPNARSAMTQSIVAAENILLATKGKPPAHEYHHHWAEELIKLTLGLDRSVTYLSDGKSELLFETKEKDEALMAAMCWRRLGQTPFKDVSEPETKMT